MLAAASVVVGNVSGLANFNKVIKEGQLSEGASNTLLLIEVLLVICFCEGST